MKKQIAAPKETHKKHIENTEAVITSRQVLDKIKLRIRFNSDDHIQTKKEAELKSPRRKLTRTNSKLRMMRTAKDLSEIQFNRSHYDENLQLGKRIGNGTATIKSPDRKPLQDINPTNTQKGNLDNINSNKYSQKTDPAKPIDKTSLVKRVRAQQVAKTIDQAIMDHMDTLSIDELTDFFKDPQLGKILFDYYLQICPPTDEISWMPAAAARGRLRFNMSNYNSLIIDPPQAPTEQPTAPPTNDHIVWRSSASRRHTTPGKDTATVKKIVPTPPPERTALNKQPPAAHPALAPHDPQALVNPLLSDEAFNPEMDENAFTQWLYTSKSGQEEFDRTYPFFRKTDCSVYIADSNHLNRMKALYAIQHAPQVTDQNEDNEEGPQRKKARLEPKTND